MSRKERLGIDLREDKVGSSVNLLLEPRHLLLSTSVLLRRLWVTSREASDRDTEPVAVLLANVADELGGGREPGRDRLPSGRAERRVTAESEDVSAPRVLGELQIRRNRDRSVSEDSMQGSSWLKWTDLQGFVKLGLLDCPKAKHSRASVSAVGIVSMRLRTNRRSSA